MHTGTKTSGREWLRTKLCTVMARMPALGGSMHRQAAPALDEVFDGETAVDHQVQVLEENRGIQRLALQRLRAQEEGVPERRRIEPTTGRLRLAPAGA